MAIDDTSVIDFVSVDDANNVNLTISDHLDWAETEKHLMLLQEKINTYCKYVENGQLYDEYPQTRDRRPAIEVVFFHAPVAEAERFLEKPRSTLEHEGFSFSWGPYGAG
jgi:Family of unknown function (DUF6572)